MDTYPQGQLVTGAEQHVHDRRQQGCVQTVHGGQVGKQRVAHPHWDAHDSL